MEYSKCFCPISMLPFHEAGNMSGEDSTGRRAKSEMATWSPKSYSPLQVIPETTSESQESSRESSPALRELLATVIANENAAIEMSYEALLFQISNAYKAGYLQGNSLKRVKTGATRMLNQARKSLQAVSDEVDRLLAHVDGEALAELSKAISISDAVELPAAVLQPAVSSQCEPPVVKLVNYGWEIVHGDSEDQGNAENRRIKPVPSKTPGYDRLSTSGVDCCLHRKIHNDEKVKAEIGRRQNAVGDVSDGSEDEILTSKTTSHKPFFRRLSFKGLRKGRGFFSKQADDGKTKLAKIVVECRKEGVVHYLMGEQPDGTHRWERCRLALVKTVGGYMLEFYWPPKSSKPRCGVFCFLIIEARETTALEMPDHENTFVLNADNQTEYVIEAQDADDMRSWLATIKYCMRVPRTLTERLEARTLINGSKSEPDTIPEAEPPPDLPPRVDANSTSSSGHLHNGSNPDVHNSRTDIDAQVETELDLSATLKDYPWFHGTLPRAEAATLVLHDGPTGHGIFLVRQSETRKGEFVLTFNFQGRAKHLRMTLNDLGQCRVQHLWFPTILDMLEHFREHTIPLESGGTEQVMLTQYVLAPHQPPQASGSRSWPAHGVDRRPAPHPDVTEVVTFNGSIRTRTESLERLTDIRQNGSASSNRAVENTYSFV